MNPSRLPMRAGQSAKLRDLGYDEIWLQNWLAADLTVELYEAHVASEDVDHLAQIARLAESVDAQGSGPGRMC